MSEDIRAQLLSPLIRFSRVTLDKPRVYKDPETGKENGEPKFGLGMLFTPEDLKKFRQEQDGKLVEVDVKAIGMELCKQKWPELTLQEMFPKKPTGDSDWPIKDGNKQIELNAKKKKPKKLDFLAGMFQIGTSASHKYPPLLQFNDPTQGNKRVTLDREIDADMKQIKKLFVPGNYGICEVSIVPNEVNGKCYLSFYLNRVLFKKTGERIGGGSSLMDRFEGIDGGEGDFDPNGDDDFGDV